MGFALERGLALEATGALGAARPLERRLAIARGAGPERLLAGGCGESITGRPRREHGPTLRFRLGLGLVLLLGLGPIFGLRSRRGFGAMFRLRAMFGPRLRLIGRPIVGPVGSVFALMGA